MVKRGVILAWCVFLVIIMASFIAAGFMASLNQIRLRERLEAEMYANYALESGVNRVLFELSRDANWGGNTPNTLVVNNFPVYTQNNAILLGDYSITFLNQTSTGLWNTRTYRIDAISQHGLIQVRKATQIEVNVVAPSKFSFFVLSSLNIGTGVNIETNDGNILAKDIKFLNTGGGTIYINGTVNYLGSTYNYDPSFVTITGGVPQKTQPVTFSGVDIEYYKSLAQNGGLYIKGNQNIDSSDIKKDNVLGNSTSNGVVFVDGNLDIKGQIKETIIFVSNGTISFSGNVECHEGAQVGFFAKGNVTIPTSAPQDIKIDGLIISNGVFKAEGDKGSKNKLEFTGGIVVKGTESGTAIDLNVYKERSYTYDANFQANPQIPYLLNVVSLIKREDVYREVVVK